MIPIKCPGCQTAFEVPRGADRQDDPLHVVQDALTVPAPVAAAVPAGSGEKNRSGGRRGQQARRPHSRGQAHHRCQAHPRGQARSGRRQPQAAAGRRPDVAK